MINRRLTAVAASLAALMTLAACANTVRGVGQDVGATVDATEGAARNIAR